MQCVCLHLFSDQICRLLHNSLKGLLVFPEAWLHRHSRESNTTQHNKRLEKTFFQKKLHLGVEVPRPMLLVFYTLSVSVFECNCSRVWVIFWGLQTWVFYGFSGSDNSVQSIIVCLYWKISLHPFMHLCKSPLLSIKYTTAMKAKETLAAIVCVHLVGYAYTELPRIAI